MKKILTISLMSFSAMVFASYYQTLEQYDASNLFMVNWPTIIFSNLSVPVKNVCIDGDNLKTISAVKYCSEPVVVEVCVSRGNSEHCRPVTKGENPVQTTNTRLVWGCATYSTRNFVTTRSYQAPVCLKWKVGGNEHSHNGPVWECIKFGTETKEYDLSYDVSVTRSAHNHESGPVEVANLNFTIAQCK